LSKQNSEFNQALLKTGLQMHCFCSLHYLIAVQL